jgi:hypothetical protein
VKPTPARVAAVGLWFTGLGVGVSATIGQREDVLILVLVSFVLAVLLDWEVRR